jgi:hypothetical protein
MVEAKDKRRCAASCSVRAAEIAGVYLDAWDTAAVPV